MSKTPKKKKKKSKALGIFRLHCVLLDSALSQAQSDLIWPVSEVFIFIFFVLAEDKTLGDMFDIVWPRQ